MGDKSKIEWTEATWNPITGCTPISEGCANCYAKREAETRLRGRCGYDKDDPFKVTFHESRLDQPLRWTKPRKIFVCSMGDLFHEDVPVKWINDVFRVIQRATAHRFMVLTKRPERMRDYFRRVLEARGWPEGDVPFSNVWAGVTVENQKRAEERTPILLDTPAAVRFVSVEPMLGPISLIDQREPHFEFLHDIGIGSTLDWVICGGETGPGARPMHPDWVRSLRDQCQFAGTPFFFKSWGAWAPRPFGECTHMMRSDSGHVFPEPRDEKRCGSMWKGIARVGKKAAGRLLDGRTWDEEPEVG